MNGYTRRTVLALQHPTADGNLSERPLAGGESRAIKSDYAGTDSNGALEARLRGALAGRGSLQRGGHALGGGVGGQLVAVLRQVVLASMSLILLLRFTVAREISSGIITARPIACERSRIPEPT